MTKDEITATIRQFLVDDFEVDEASITPEANLKETLDLDSLDYVDLVVSIESHFGFKVKPEDFAKMVTVDNFYNYVVEKVVAKIEA